MISAVRPPLRLLLPLLAGTLLVAAAGQTLAAQSASARADSAAFVTRLGSDTLALERFVRTGNRVEADVLLRVPRTTRTRYVMQLSPAGEMQRLEAVTVGASGDTTRRETITRAGDSLRVAITGERPQNRTVAAPSVTMPFIDMVHWPYELVLMRARAMSVDTVVQPLLTGQRTSDFRVSRIGGDSMAITHPFRGTMRARVDGEGRLLGLDAGETTRKLIVERQRWIALDAPAERWRALDAAGRGVGALSGRGEAEGTVGRASIGVDYGVPLKRGREIWGALVPWGELWRTGANLATHLTTDRALTLGAGSDTVHLAAGRYTLFSIPEQGGGTLIVSRQTGQNGNSYDPSQDLGRVRMTARPLNETVEAFTIAVTPVSDGADRGELRLQWDRLELVTPVRAH